MLERPGRVLGGKTEREKQGEAGFLQHHRSAGSWVQHQRVREMGPQSESRGGGQRERRAGVGTWNSLLRALRSPQPEKTPPSGFLLPPEWEGVRY